MEGVDVATIEFTLLVNNCLGCQICPQDKLGSAYKANRKMSLEDYIFILSKIPLDVRIDFSGFSEPYLHPDIDTFITIAVTKGYHVHIYSTLIGMRTRQAEELQQHPPEYFRVHVPDRHNLILKDDLWIRQHETFLKSGIRGSYMAMDQLTDSVCEYLRSLKIDVELPRMISRAGNVEFMKPAKKEGKVWCAAKRWHSNVVLPNGDVYACCMDWGLSMPVGNLLRQPYQEIFDKASEYEANLNPPDDSICRTCEWSESL